MDNKTLTITDNRTGKTYTLPLDKGNIRTPPQQNLWVDSGSGSRPSV